MLPVLRGALTWTTGSVALIYVFTMRTWALGVRLRRAAPKNSTAVTVRAALIRATQTVTTRARTPRERTDAHASRQLPGHMGGAPFRPR